MYELSKCEKIEIDQGAMYLGPSDKTRSVGYLELNHKTSLTLHNRPAIEHLIQIKGSSTIIVYDQPTGRLVTLQPKDTITIKPAGTWHIHANPFNEVSLTYWDFMGDISKIITKIRHSGES